VQSANGEVADIPAIVEAAGRVGALTVLDATQAAGWLPLSARDVDILTAGAYKWLCAPRGTAFATLHPDLERRHPDIATRLLPLSAGWFAGSSGAYYGMPLRLAADARRFDISPAWHSWVGTAPALDVLLAVGVAEVGAHDVGLANELRRALDLEPSNSAIVSVPVAPAAVDRLRQAGIRFVVMDGRVRLAFHLYTTVDDVAAAVTAIKG
jgi:selenocysteine lyase/cysteine desulfurase